MVRLIQFFRWLISAIVPRRPTAGDETPVLPPPQTTEVVVTVEPPTPEPDPPTPVVPEEQPVAVPQPKGPFLFVDIYWGDLGRSPDFTLMSRQPNVWGCIVKATDGRAGYSHEDWFLHNWSRVRAADQERYDRQEWLRGCYHFLRFTQDGKQQAEYYCRTVEKAGGWGPSDIIPIVDVEDGPDGGPNALASAQQVIDCTSLYAARVKSLTGRRVMLYGRGSMRDRKIRSKMNCDVAWNPAYTRTMVGNGLTEVGGRPGPWQVTDLALWQYGGDGVGDNSVHRLPLSFPALGRPTDLSVAIDGSNRVTWDRVLRTLVL